VPNERDLSDWIQPKVETRGLRKLRRDPLSETRITVGDIMSSPVYSLPKTETVTTAAMEMELRGIGSILVANSSGKTVGIITERDIITRVIAKGKDPSNSKLEEVMSSPLVKIDHDKNVMKALDAMRLHKLRRLGVVKDEKLVGIVTERDIISAVPAILEQYYEKTHSIMPAVNNVERYEGYCEECGQWSERLLDYEGRFMCDECVTDLGGQVEGT